MSLRRPSTKSALFALSLTLSAGAALTACKGGGGYRGGKKSPARAVARRPVERREDGQQVQVGAAATEFEIPDTLYVFKNCEEDGHSPEGEDQVGAAGRVRVDGAAASDEDGVGRPLRATADAIALTFYLAPKERPVDERAVAYFTNEYKEAGLKVEELAYNDDYFSKNGIFAKLQVMDESGTNAVREIQQFMWPIDDVLFIARMEYPYGDTRAIQQDWKAIMPYFKVGKPTEKGAVPVSQPMGFACP
jgi:hypothetical protein